MSTSGDLLRLLMPAVSPVPTRDVVRPEAQPIESRSFESLLEEAGRAETLEPAASGDAGAGKAEASGVRPLADLSGIESVQNASLRQLIADARGR